MSCYTDIDNNNDYNMSIPHRHPHMASPRPHAVCAFYTDQVFILADIIIHEWLMMRLMTAEL